ncbi:MAG: Bromodomain-containing protein [Linnemannia gamsii]|nr:MAG: Bromodomain-containing protein [Linnemannia gamsii]
MPPRKKSAASKGPASIAEDLPLDNKQEAIAMIIERLENLKDKSGHPVSELFLELPNREDYPDYYQIIQTPIAFDVIKGRLDAGLYTEETIGDFARDLKTMTTNAKTYNRDGSMVYRDATFLEGYIQAAIKALTTKEEQQPKREEFSADFCRRILDAIKDYEDKGGRKLAELFLELPSAKEYPDYYDEITKPIAIGDIEEKVDQGEYPTLEGFEKDVNQMFDNAKQYNAEGSDVYLDAEELQQLFWKSIGKNGRGRQSKGKRPRKHENELQEVFHNGDVYKVGDFVHIRNESDPSKPIIGLIFGLWVDAKGVKRVDAGWFLRPEQIIVPYASRFYASEVVKMSERVDYLLDDVQGRCFVLQTKDYVRGRPVSWKEGQTIYVCEQRYNESYKSVTKIKNWANCLPPGQKNDSLPLTPFPYPLVLKKLPSASMLHRAGKQDTSEPVSRINTPQGSAYTAESEESESEETEESGEPSPSASPSVSPEASPMMKPKAAPKKTKAKTAPKTTPKSPPAPKATKTNKRKSSQIQPEALVAPSTKIKIIKKAKPSEQESHEPEVLAPERPPAQQAIFHCVYPYPGTKTVCSE